MLTPILHGVFGGGAYPVRSLRGAHGSSCIPASLRVHIDHGLSLGVIAAKVTAKRRHEFRPGGFLLGQQVILTFQRYELCIGNQ